MKIIKHHNFKSINACDTECNHNQPNHALRQLIMANIATGSDILTKREKLPPIHTIHSWYTRMHLVVCLHLYSIVKLLKCKKIQNTSAGVTSLNRSKYLYNNLHNVRMNFVIFSIKLKINYWASA